MSDLDRASLIGFVQQSPLFAELPKPQFADIAEAIRFVLKPRGAVLFNRNEPALKFYIVVEGWAKVYRTTSGGEEAIIGIFTRGQSFAEIAALAGDNYPANAETVTDAHLAEIRIDRIVAAIRSDPSVALTMLSSVSRQVRRLVDEIEQMKGLSGMQRFAEFLVEQSPVRTGACTVRLPYEKSVIAAKLGMKAESLSRVFPRMRKYGVVIKNNMAIINEVEALQDAIDQDRLRAASR